MRCNILVTNTENWNKVEQILNSETFSCNSGEVNKGTSTCAWTKEEVFASPRLVVQKIQTNYITGGRV